MPTTRTPRSARRGSSPAHVTARRSMLRRSRSTRAPPGCAGPRRWRPACGPTGTVRRRIAGGRQTVQTSGAVGDQKVLARRVSGMTLEEMAAGVPATARVVTMPWVMRSSSVSVPFADATQMPAAVLDETDRTVGDRNGDAALKRGREHGDGVVIRVRDVEMAVAVRSAAHGELPVATGADTDSGRFVHDTQRRARHRKPRRTPLIRVSPASMTRRTPGPTGMAADKVGPRA